MCGSARGEFADTHAACARSDSGDAVNEAVRSLVGLYHRAIFLLWIIALIGETFAPSPKLAAVEQGFTRAASGCRITVVPAVVGPAACATIFSAIHHRLSRHINGLIARVIARSPGCESTVHDVLRGI